MDNDTLIARLRERGSAEDMAAAAALAQHKHGKDAFLGSTAYSDYAVARNHARAVWDSSPSYIPIPPDQFPGTASECHAEHLAHVLSEIKDERTRQDQRWGGPEHDDGHDALDWYLLLHRHITLLTDGGGQPAADYRDRLAKIAAIAVAAIQVWDRTNPPAKES